MMFWLNVEVTSDDNPVKRLLRLQPGAVAAVEEIGEKRSRIILGGGAAYYVDMPSKAVCDGIGQALDKIRKGLQQEAEKEALRASLRDVGLNGARMPGRG